MSSFTAGKHYAVYGNGYVDHIRNPEDQEKILVMLRYIYKNNVSSLLSSMSFALLSDFHFGVIAGYVGCDVKRILVLMKFEELETKGQLPAFSIERHDTDVYSDHVSNRLKEGFKIVASLTMAQCTIFMHSYSEALRKKTAMGIF